MPVRLQQTLTDGLGLFTLVIGLTLALQFTLTAGRPVGEQLAALAALLVGAAVGELLRISDRLDALGDWFQRRLAPGEQPSRVSELRHRQPRLLRRAADNPGLDPERVDRRHHWGQASFCQP